MTVYNNNDVIQQYIMSRDTNRGITENNIEGYISSRDTTRTIRVTLRKKRLNRTNQRPFFKGESFAKLLHCPSLDVPAASAAEAMDLGVELHRRT